MTQPKRIAIAAILLLCIFATYFYSRRETTFQGRRVSDWFNEYGNTRGSLVESSPSQSAFLNMGGDAIPYLAAVLDERETSKFYFAIWNKLPKALARILPQPKNLGEIKNRRRSALQLLGYIGGQQDAFKNEHGRPDGKPDISRAMPGIIRALQEKEMQSWTAQSCSYIGPKARAAAPLLIKILDSDTEDDHDKIQCIQALNRIGPPDASAAMPAFVKILRGTNNDLRASAAQNIGQIGGDVKEALPSLVRMLEDADRDVRYGAVRAFAVIPTPLEAKPALIRFLPEDNDYLRLGAAVALWRNDKQNTKALEVINECLQSPKEPNLQTVAIYYLGRAGTNAKPFVPLLKKIPNGKADFALRKIEAEAIEKTNRK